MKLEHPRSIEEVQHRLDQWLEIYYHDKVHSGTGKTPRKEFQHDWKLQRFVSREELNLAFTLTEQWLVDKTGCISFRSRKFEAGVDVIGFRVSVAYSADNPTGRGTCASAPAIRPMVEAEHSRMLRAIEKKDERAREGATSNAEILHRGMVTCNVRAVL